MEVRGITVNIKSGDCILNRLNKTFSRQISSTFVKKIMTSFELQGHDHIQLNQLLKLLNLAESGGEANQVITAGLAKVNGKTELQKRKKLFPGDTVEFEGHLIKIAKSPRD